MSDDPPPPNSVSVPEERGLLSRTWVECLKAISAAPDVAQAWAKSGVSYLQSTVGSLRLFSSTRIDAAAGNPAQDETHYFLIPSPDGYVLAERRRLPDGVGTVNSLPKVRIFHVHDPAGVAVLEERLLGKLLANKPIAAGWEGDLAKRLEIIGEEIDQQSSLVTGGLVVLGGVVAIANPLLGIGIAAKALLPGLSSKLTKLGLGAAADSMRSIGSSWRERSTRNEVKSEIRRLKPQVIVDPVLTFVDGLVALGAKADPQMSELDRLPEWWRQRDQRLTMAVLSDVLKATDPWPRWLQSVRERLGELPR